MTFNEMTKQIYDISYKHHINHETKNLTQFRRELKSYFDQSTRLPTQIAFEMEMKDGYWYCVAIKSAWGYDYYIPDTRKDEEKLKKETGYYDT